MSSFMMDHATAFAGREVVMTRASDSHANRGMNKIANAFLESDCDVWINLDADIRFRRVDIDNLLSHAFPDPNSSLVTGHSSLSLVYGIYPKKEDAASPCLCTFAEVPEPDPITGLAEVRRCGRGFMLVKREVLEAMKEDNGGPALRYHNHGKIEWDFFPSGPVTGAFSALHKSESGNHETTKEDSEGHFITERCPQCGSSLLGNAIGDKWCSFVGGRSEKACDFSSSVPGFLVSKLNLDPDGFPIREWISEDWYFCEVARSLGYKTFVDTRIALGHVGQKEYRFGPDQVTRVDSNITSWREIHGWFDYEPLYRHLAKKLTADYADNTDPDLSFPIPSETSASSAVKRFPVFVEVGCWLGRSIAAMAEFIREAALSSPVSGFRFPHLHVVDTFQGAPANQDQANILQAHGGSVENAFRANMLALGIRIIESGTQETRNDEEVETGPEQNPPGFLASRFIPSLSVHAKSSLEAAADFSDHSIDAIFIDGDHSEAAVRADIAAWLPKVKLGGIICGHDIDEPGVAAAVTAAFSPAGHSSLVTGHFQQIGRCWLVRL
jgi:hypothetical protein